MLWGTRPGCWWRFQGRREGNWGAEDGEANGVWSQTAMQSAGAFGFHPGSWGTALRTLSRAREDSWRGREDPSVRHVSVLRPDSREPSAFKVLSFTKPPCLITSETAWTGGGSRLSSVWEEHPRLDGDGWAGCPRGFIRTAGYLEQGPRLLVQLCYPVSIKCLCKVGPH